MVEQNTFSVPKFLSFKLKESTESTEHNAREEWKPGSRVLGDSAKRSMERSRSKSPDRKRQRREIDRHSSSRYERREHRRRSRSRNQERLRHHDNDKSDRHERLHRRHRSRSRSRERKRRYEDERSRYEGNHHHKRRRSRSKSPSPQPPWSTINTSPPSYIIDGKGDENNLRYNRVHRYDIPRFRRFGYSCVLGLHRQYRIQRSGLEDVDGIIVSSESSKPEKRENYVFARNEKKGARLLKIRDDATTEGDLDENPDFVPLRRKRERISDESEDDEYALIAFRSIESSGRDVGKLSDEDLEYASESGPEDNDLAMKFRKADLAAREKLRKHAAERGDTFPGKVK